MLPDLRKQFNLNFTEEQYARLLRRMDSLCGDHIPFRISETPVFLPTDLIRTIATYGGELITQAMAQENVLQQARDLIPARFRAPNENPHPLFVAVDFGLTVDQNGKVVPKLIEMQGFPTMFVYQTVLTQQYREMFDLPRALTSLMSGLTTDTYFELFRRVILGSHDPENVVLLELDPHLQKTRVDFILTDRVCGIRTVNKRDLIKERRRLFYRHEGKKIQIHRIYNRTIADEVLRSGGELPFNFSDDVDVEWAGHPNWYFTLSKFSIPFLKHPAVPPSLFVSDSSLPKDLDGWVLKPLFSFAGSGVIMNPTGSDIDRIPSGDRKNYILQEKVHYQGLVDTPHGMTKCEIRMMYFWPDDQPIAVNNLVRMGRGEMMGVDQNKGQKWVGSSAGLYAP